MTESQSYELIRVATESVERLVTDESEPVVVISIERHDDGTAELILRTAEDRNSELLGQRDDLVEALAEAVRAHTRAIHALAGNCDYPDDERWATGKHLAELLADLRPEEER